MVPSDLKLVSNVEPVENTSANALSGYLNWLVVVTTHHIAGTYFLLLLFAYHRVLYRYIPTEPLT